MPSLSLVRYVLTAALRDKVLMAYAVAVIVGICLSLFLSSAAVIEKDQFALVFTAGGLRIVTILALTLFVVFHMRRSFDSKDVEFLLSRPLGRITFLLSHSLAFSLLALIFSLMTCLVVYLGAMADFGSAHLLWMVSIAIEAIIIVNVALFFSMVLTSAVGATLATCGFYVLCRMMGQILGIIDSDHNGFFKIMNGVMQLISSVMPRLDLMGQTSWLIYGTQTQISFGFVFAQGAVFIILVLSASLIDLMKRQF